MELRCFQSWTSLPSSAHRRRFRALLCGDATTALSKLATGQRLALVAPFDKFTVLHAAVLGRAAAALPHLADATVALPQLVAACAAAGIPVDAQLEGHASFSWRNLLRDLGYPWSRRSVDIAPQATALSIAVR